MLFDFLAAALGASFALAGDLSSTPFLVTGRALFSVLFAPFLFALLFGSSVTGFAFSLVFDFLPLVFAADSSATGSAVPLLFDFLAFSAGSSVLGGATGSALGLFFDFFVGVGTEVEKSTSLTSRSYSLFAPRVLIALEERGVGIRNPMAS